MTPDQLVSSGTEAGQQEPTARLMSRTPRPADRLTAEQTQRCIDTLRRLCSEVRKVVELLPPEMRSGGALAKSLQIDRSTCYRFVGAAYARADDPELMARLPGVQGFRSICAALRQHGLDQGWILSLDAAVRELEALIGEYGGSRNRLLERIRVTTGQPMAIQRTERIGEEDLSRREALAENAFLITGRRSAVYLSLRIVTRSPSHPDCIRRAMINGVIGHVAEADAMPLAFVTGRVAGRTDSAAAAESPVYEPFEPVDESCPSALLLQNFSSSPSPVVVSRGRQRGMVHLVDARRMERGKPADVLLGMRQNADEPHPAREDPPIDEYWTFVDYPAEWLLFDVYTHRELARASTVDVDAHLWKATVATTVGDRWYTRLHTEPRLELLGAGLGKADSAAYVRQRELTQYAFDRLGLRAEEFVGFRCQERFPIWRAGYRIAFDYQPESPSEHDSS